MNLRVLSKEVNFRLHHLLLCLWTHAERLPQSKVALSDSVSCLRQTSQHLLSVIVTVSDRCEIFFWKKRELQR